MVSFRIREHSIRPGTQIVEVLIDGNVAGVIYPDQDKSIRIVSAHIEEKTVEKNFAGKVVVDKRKSSWPSIPAVIISFNPSPYVIVGGKIVKIPV